MLDQPVTAQEALHSGFVNGIITDLNSTDHWPDLSKIPAITSLLGTDYRTIVNCKELMNAARDNSRIEQTINREARALVETWMDEDFPPKLMEFMMSVMNAKENQRPKL